MATGLGREAVSEDARATAPCPTSDAVHGGCTACTTRGMDRKRLWRGAIVLTLLTGLSGCSGGPTAPDATTTDAAPGPVASATPSPSPQAASEASAVIELTNNERRSAGVAPLRMSAALMTAAQLHANQMAELQKMEHTLSDA